MKHKETLNINKMLSEMIKFSSQHRALYCYLIMSVWIFLIVAGMYKYIATEEASMPKISSRRDIIHNFRDAKMKKIVSKYCNAPENIKVQAEGLALDDAWALQGVIVVVRHGDRGPLTHVRNIDKVSCDPPLPSIMLQRYQEYIANATGSGRAPWAQVPGPFHSFPLLPGTPTASCRLGQLTLLGVQQLLTTGGALGEAYSSALGWDLRPLPPDASNDTTDVTAKGSSRAEQIKYHSLTLKKSDVLKGDDTKDNSDDSKSMTLAARNDGTTDSKNALQGGKPGEGDIVVHSTRYRRALQSALALVWGSLGGRAGAGGAAAHESPSLTFCSADCACPAADNYAKLVSQELRDRLDSHPAIGELVTQLSKIVFQSSSQVSKNPHILEDALLAYVCHGAPLPCIERPVEQPKSAQKTANNPVKPVLTDNLKTKDGRMRSLLSVMALPGNVYHPFLAEGTFERVRRPAVKVKPKPIVLDFDAQMEKEKLGYYKQKMMENSDTNYQDVDLVKKNIDGDFNFNSEIPNNQEIHDDGDADDYDDNEKEHSGKPSKGDMETLCARKDQVTGLFAYTDWEMKQYAKSKNLKKASLLRAYGMIRHIVQYLLKMISEGKPKFVLFSGHDKTLQYLTLALGLADDTFLHIHYASRLVVEVYRNVNKDHPKYENVASFRNDHRAGKPGPPLDFYLRVVMNGQDVTNQLTFCRGKRSIVVTSREMMDRSGRGKVNKYYLCRIENIIRFTHEDYFSIFNATNFKDACALR